MTVNVNNPTASGMILTFDDEFNSNSTSSDNAASGTQWSNHLWYDSADPGAISVANGVLSLASGGELSSVDSSGQGFAQKYGYFEIDMKVPAGVGTWPAFWLMSQQHVVNGANPASEIDVIEGQGNKANGYYTTLHSNTGSGSDQVNPMPNYTGDVSTTALSAGYHRFGVLWDPNSSQITYYFDGKAVGTSTIYSTTDYSADMLLIDNWLGDIGWGGNTPTSQNEGALQIDYVRAYQFAGQGATAITAQTVSSASGQNDATALASASGTVAAADPPAQAPSLTVAAASGSEGSSIPLSITAAQAAANLVASDLTVTVSNLNGATLNHGTLSNGVYTLHASDLSGLTVTPGATFTGSLALHVTATDTEATSTASSAMQTLNVTVTAPATSGVGASGGGGTGSSFNPQTAGMVLTFDDEFNSASISSDGAANHTLWNNHLWYESANPAGVSVANGVATFASGGDLSTIDSAGQGFSQKYGYFEAKVSFTGGAGDVPAFWLMNAQKATSAAAPGTDIDVLHAQTNDLTHYTGSVQSDVGMADNTVGSNVINLTQGAHTYGVLWTPGAANLIWYLDGQQVATTAAPASLSSGAAMLNLSFYPGTGADAPTAGSNPSMQVDWVHVYQYASQSPTAVTPQVGFSEPTTVAADPPAQAPSLTVAAASGVEGSSIPLSIVAAQASANLAASDLTVTVSNLNGATLNHGTLSNGVYTLHAADLSGLTVTPGSTFTGSLALHVTATDTEAASTASSAMQTLAVTVTPPAAQAPSLTIAAASGGEGSSIPLSIVAAQASTNLLASDLTVTVSNLNGATLNHGTLSNGVYTLHASDLSGLTVTPGSTFSGSLALHVTATDTEAASSASSAMQTLNVTVTAPITSGVGSSGGTTPSANDTIVAGTNGGIVTAAGNAFAINAAGQITENGAVMAVTHGVTELAYVNGTLYQEATAQNLWFSYNEASSQWAQTSNPLSASTAPADPLAVTPTLSVTNASGNEGSAIALSITAAQAAANLAASDLTVTVSNLDGATLNHGTLSNGVYTLHASDLSGLTVTPGSSFTGTLALHVTATDTEPTSNTSASSTPETLDVTVTAPITPSANDTIVAGTSGDIVTAAGHAFAINAAGQITENGTAMTVTHGVTELAYVNGTLYQEATAQHLWFSYNETSSQWAQTSDPLPASTSTSGSGATTAGVGSTVVHAMAPMLSVYQASGSEGSSVPLYIHASQDSGSLPSSNLSITVSGLGSATLNHGTETNGVYTLKASDLSGLTLTPAATFTGTLPLHVTATDTEGASSASSVTATLSVSVTAPAATAQLMQPSFSDGGHSLYLLDSLSTGSQHIASFNPATDLLDVAPLLNMIGYKGTDPIGDHVLNLEATANGGTAVMIDPTGVSPTHGTTVVTLDHVLPQSVPATDVWH